MSEITINPACLEPIKERLDPIVKDAANEMYRTLMESVQDYLIYNVEYNIGAKIAVADRQTAYERRRADDLAQINVVLVNALVAMIPTNVALGNDAWLDDTVVPIDFTLGDLRRARAAIALATNQKEQ